MFFYEQVISLHRTEHMEAFILKLQPSQYVLKLHCIINTEHKLWEGRGSPVICYKSHRGNVVNLYANSHK